MLFWLTSKFQIIDWENYEQYKLEYYSNDCRAYIKEYLCESFAVNVEKITRSSSN
jgi:hypothetical protein